MGLYGTSSILDDCPKKSFSSAYDLGKRFFGHPSRIDNIPIKLTQFCHIMCPVCKGYQYVALESL